MKGAAVAPAAGTILNALATGRGAAFAIDEEVEATVELTPDDPGVEGTVVGAPEADTRLIQACVERVLDAHGPEIAGGSVTTESDVPMASGLKSSSAAANATVLATLAALDAAEDVDREDAARIGVEAAREVGVTVTGAFDDASASMLGGVTVTDNANDELLDRDEVDWDVLVWTPPEKAYSADANVDRCEQIAPMARLVESMTLDGEFGPAMTVNGLAFCAALDFDPEPIVDAMPVVEGVSLSGTGPSFTAVGDADALEPLAEMWAERPGEIRQTTTRAEGAMVR